ncbi:adenylate/guanylate cyclase domain-containing protein [Desulfoplanes sp. PS50]
MKLRTKLFLGIFGIAFLVSGATGSYFYTQSCDAVMHTLQQELMSTARSAARLIKGNDLDSLIVPEQAKSQPYKEIQKVLRAVVDSNPDFLYAYTMRLTKGEVRFVVDSPPADNDGDGKISDMELPEDIGTLYPNPVPSLMHGFLQPSADDQPYEDKWGWTLSGYAPVLDDSGRGVGLLGIDMSITQVAKKLKKIEKAGIFSFALTTLLACILTFFFSRKVVKPVKSLQDAFHRVAEGDYNVVLEPASKDEIGDLVNRFNILVGELKEKALMKSNFGKIVPPEIVERMLASDFTRGSEVVSVTVLFCDLRGFTAMSENLPPSMLVGLLNEYFSAMVKIIESHGGMVDKFIGDKVMAVFGHPVPLANEQQAALDAAREMLAKCDQLNKKLCLTGDFKLINSIGIHTGPALAGIIGSPDRSEYTVIGDSVNVAARLETKTRQLATRLVLSHDVIKGLASLPLDLIPKGKQQIRGRHDSIEILALEDIHH